MKEPQSQEYSLIREGQIVFTYFHFAASRELTDAMVQSGATCYAYETLDDRGRLPLLTPMSEVAGRMSIQEGAKFLEKPQRVAAFCLVASPASLRLTSRFLAAALSARMPRGSRPVFKRTFPFWMSISIACDISMT